MALPDLIDRRVVRVVIEHDVEAPCSTAAPSASVFVLFGTSKASKLRTRVAGLMAAVLEMHLPPQLSVFVL